MSRLRTECSWFFETMEAATLWPMKTDMLIVAVRRAEHDSALSGVRRHDLSKGHPRCAQSVRSFHDIYEDASGSDISR